ncbi:uncharacterized protein VTP21DRAFT_4218 [Calcarisporiella thermophila]|uniref:uncharacterized protein n=1 Tax=Calcarisporiella thermophila TaxID=911321 RepID=UPI003742F56B
MKMRISNSLIHQFHTKGYAICENVLSQTEIKLLRDECDVLVNFVYNDRDLLCDMGCVIETLSCGYFDAPDDKDYKTNRDTYVNMRSQINRDVISLLLGKIPAIAKQFLLFENVYLFNEQYIVKPPRSSQAQFAWHQDSEYMDNISSVVPSISCWIALDDVDENNGTLFIEPYVSEYSEDVTPNNLDEYSQFHRGLAKLYPPITDAQSSSQVTVRIQAGSIVFMSGYVRHRSIGNSTSKFRRVFMPQYSAGVVKSPKGGPLALAIAC